MPSLCADNDLSMASPAAPTLRLSQNTAMPHSSAFAVVYLASFLGLVSAWSMRRRTTFEGLSPYVGIFSITLRAHLRVRVRRRIVLLTRGSSDTKSDSGLQQAISTRLLFQPLSPRLDNDMSMDAA
jgi:hypothetical protein